MLQQVEFLKEKEKRLDSRIDNKSLSAQTDRIALLFAPINSVLNMKELLNMADAIDVLISNKNTKMFSLTYVARNINNVPTETRIAFFDSARHCTMGSSKVLCCVGNIIYFNNVWQCK
jgi:hypothetical protein